MNVIYPVIIYQHFWPSTYLNLTYSYSEFKHVLKICGQAIMNVLYVLDVDIVLISVSKQVKLIIYVFVTFF